MFVFTLSKKRAAKTALAGVAAVVGVAVGVTALLSAVNTGASETKRPIYKVDRSDNKISLSFDCAYGNSNTDALLKVLSDEKVPATFFVTGDFCDKYGGDVTKMYQAGHEIGNNSDKHPHIVEKGKSINVNALIEDTKAAQTKIKTITGTAPTLYRAPFGEYDNNSLTTIEGMGLTPVQWSVDSTDSREPAAEAITKAVVDGTTSGSIVLLHNDIANTDKALPTIIKSLREKGFEFVPVGNLLYKGEYTVDANGVQVPKTKDAFDPTKEAALESAVQTLKTVITADDIASLQSGGISPQLAMKLTAVLSPEEINLLKNSDPALIVSMFTQPVMAEIEAISGDASFNVKGGAVGAMAGANDAIPAGGEDVTEGKDGASTLPGGLANTQPGGLANTQPGGLANTQPGSLAATQPGSLAATQPGSLSGNSGGNSDSSPANPPYEAFEIPTNPPYEAFEIPTNAPYQAHEIIANENNEADYAAGISDNAAEPANAAANEQVKD